MLPHWDVHIFPLGENHIPFLNQLCKPLIAQPVQHLKRRLPFNYIGKPCRLIGVKIAPVVEKAIVVRFNIFPRPILPG